MRTSTRTFCGWPSRHELPRSNQSTKEASAVTEDDDFNRLVRRTAFTTVALGFALVFGIMLLVGGDWIPGGIIVGSTLVGLAVEIPVIRRLCGRPGT
jgi:hypothetical protein